MDFKSDRIGVQLLDYRVAGTPTLHGEVPPGGTSNLTFEIADYELRHAPSGEPSILGPQIQLRSSTVASPT